MSQITQRFSRLDESKLDLLEKMFTHTPVALCMMEEPDHRVHYANESFQKLAGPGHFEPGKPFLSLWPKMYKQSHRGLSFMDQLDSSYKSGEYTAISEYAITMEEGAQNCFYNFMFQPLKDMNGEVYGVVVVGIDVTELVNVHNRIAETENRLKLALDGANMGFCEMEIRDERIREVSTECLGHFDYDPAGRFTFGHFFNRIHPEDRANVRAAFDQAIKKRDVFEVQYRIYLDDNSLRWLQFRGKPSFNERGKPFKLFGITTDITRQKDAEQTLMEAVRLRDNFLAIASHELQTPLTSIKVRAQLLERKTRSEDYSDIGGLVTKIDNHTDQLARLTRSLIDLTKIKDGKLEMNKQEFELQPLIEESIETISPVSHHNIITEGSEKHKVYADRYRIGQVLTNLLSNAIKYSPDADRVIIRVSRRKEATVLSVVDFGIGVPEEERESVFERFFKGRDRERQTYPGFGMGLYISSQIVQRHGGELWVEDNPGGGTVFSFTIPERNKNTNGKKLNRNSWD